VNSGKELVVADGDTSIVVPTVKLPTRLSLEDPGADEPSGSKVSPAGCDIVVRVPNVDGGVEAESGDGGNIDSCPGEGGDVDPAPGDDGDVGSA
jgi:hypothetical protein